MTFRDAPPSPRPCACACVCKDPGPLAARLRLAAQQYVACLTDGEEIDGDPGGADEEYIRPFAAYLPEALVEAGFKIYARLDREAGRVMTQVRRAPIPDARPQTEETAP